MVDPHYSEVRSAEALKSDGDDALRTQQKHIKLYEQGNKPQDEKHQGNHILPAELPQSDQCSQHLHVYIQAKSEENAEETLKGDGDHKPREENSSGDTDQLEVNKSSPSIKQSETTEHSSSTSSCDTSSRTDSSQQQTGGDSEDENYSDQTADSHSFSSISSRHVAESVSNRTSINSDSRQAKREHESEDKAFSTQQVIHQPAKKTDSFFD